MIKKTLALLLILISILVLIACDNETLPYHVLRIRDSQGGTVIRNPKQDRYLIDTHIKLEAKADTNWEFSHWKINGEDISDNPYEFKISDDKIVEAIFKEQNESNQYKVIVSESDIDGKGTINVRSETGFEEDNFNHGEKIILEANPDKGWSFVRWKERNSNFPHGETEIHLKFKAVENLTLSAEFLKHYTVIFEDYDGNVIDSQKVNHGSDATAPDDPERKGYTFIGWNRSFTNVTSDLTVSATYEINTYTVTFKDFYGDEIKTEEVIYKSEATAPKVSEIDNYTFTGWDTDFTEVTENLVVKAIYESIYASYFEFENGRITGYNVQDASDSLGEDKALRVIIPSQIDGNSVTEIASSAFYNNNLTEITIPESVTEIGRAAFYKNNLSGLTISDSVVEIGDYAFSNNSLAEVIIGNSVIRIADRAFKNNQLKKVTIPNSVTDIGVAAFRSNDLTEVTIGNSVTKIRNYAFSGNNLTEIKIPYSVTEIGLYSFGFNDLIEVKIPDSVTEIGHYAFRHNDLTKVSIPSNVSIGEDAIRNDFNAFYDDMGKQEGTYILLDGNWESIYASYLEFEDGKIIGYKVEGAINSLGVDKALRVIIPSKIAGNSVTGIGNSAFRFNELREVKIPDSVTEIGVRAFSHNDLTEITIPDNVTLIDQGAFRNNNLTKVKIPDSVTEIASSAFRDNDLTKVSIPSNVSIGEDAIRNDFDVFYDDMGKQEGTYILIDYIWVLE
ncbi:leucine-rich repeat protein [Natronospora cellulosivora (SeqCode)]